VTMNALGVTADGSLQFGMLEASHLNSTLR